MQNTAPKTSKENLMSIGEASEYLGISIDTLRRWEKRGRIEPYRSPGGHRYYEKKQLDSLFGKKYERTEPTFRSTVQVPDSTERKQVFKQENEVEIKEEIIEFAAQKETFFIEREPREVKIPQTSPIRIIRDEPPPVNYSILTPPPPCPEPRYEEVSKVDEVEKDKDSSLQAQKLNFLQSLKKNKKLALIVGLTIVSVVFAIIVAVWTSSKQILSPIP